MASNPHRGEVSIALGGMALVMRPTFAALAGAEERTGRSVVDLARDAYAGTLAIRAAAAIVFEGVHAAGDANPLPPPEKAGPARIGELLVEAGYLTQLPVIAVYLMNGLRGGAPDADPAEDRAEDRAGGPPAGEARPAGASTSAG